MIPAHYTDCVVRSNNPCIHKTFNRQRLRAMTSDYARLLEAARLIKGWDTPADIARNLTLAGFRVTEQMMTNWKSRGLSKAACLTAPGIIGCSAAWLQRREGPMQVSNQAAPIHATAHSIATEPQGPYGASLPPPRASSFMVAAMRVDASSKVPPATKAALTTLLRSLVETDPSP